MRFPWTRKRAPRVSDDVHDLARRTAERGVMIKALAREAACVAREAEHLAEKNHFAEALLMSIGGTTR